LEAKAFMGSKKSNEVPVLIKPLQPPPDAYAAQLKEACAKNFQHLPLPLPTHLAPRVLTAQESEAVKRACLKTLEQGGENLHVVLKVLEEFVAFCTLLSQPENHIKKPSGQYLETEVNSRTFADMAVEMSWELAKLPRYTAYAKLL
jgi:hypothetical protein